MSNTVARSSYRRLIADILALYENAKKSLAMFYWKTGQRIVEVEQEGAVRAAYGANLLQKLSDDLIRECGAGSGFSKRNLERMRRFYLTWPKTTTSSQLTWAQYAELLTVRDARLRERLERRAAKEGLRCRDLRRLARAANCDGKPAAGTAAQALPALKRPAELKLNTCKNLTGTAGSSPGAPAGAVLLDCGFFVCHAVSKDEAACVTVTAKPAYTYAAAVERVVDGDSVPRRTAREMRVGPSEPTCRSGLQSALSGIG